MSTNTALILISFVLGILATLYVRSFDTHEKEPLFKMVVVVVWGGIWSIIIATFTYGFLRGAGLGSIDNFFGAIFVIGPVEEGAKFLALLSSYFFIRKELNEPTDGLIYMSCVALGFSLIENYSYATQTPDSSYLIFLRLFISTPAHIIFSSFMGIAFYTLMKQKSGIGLLAVSFIYASFIHGLYDAIIFHHLIFFLLLLLMYLSWRWTLSLLSYTAAKSPFKPSLKDFIQNYGETKKQRGLECLGCGSKNEKYTFRGHRFEIQKCDQCESYLVSRDSLFRIFKFFGSGYKGLKKHYSDGNLNNQRYSTLFKGNRVSENKRIAYFHLDELNEALAEFNQTIIDKFESKWWFPERLRLANTPKVAVSNDEFVFHGADEFEFE